MQSSSKRRVPWIVATTLLIAAGAHAEVTKVTIAHRTVVAGGQAFGHVGPYENERPTIDRLNAYVEEHGLEVTGRHHEIYLGDPRRTAPEKLRTVIRLPVAPASKGAGRQRSTA